MFGLAATLTEDREAFERSLELEQQGEAESGVGVDRSFSKEDLATAAEDALHKIDNSGCPADMNENEFEQIRESLQWVAQTARGVL